MAVKYLFALRKSPGSCSVQCFLVVNCLSCMKVDKDS